MSASPGLLYRFYRFAAWSQFLALTGYATYLSLTPDPGGVFASVWDKLLHLVGWFGLTLSLRAAWAHPRFPWWAVLALFLYSVGVESLQHLVPERDFNPYDLLGNATGILAGYLLARLCWPVFRRRVDRLFGLA